VDDEENILHLPGIEPTDPQCSLMQQNIFTTTPNSSTITILLNNIWPDTWKSNNPCLIIHGGHGNVTHSHDNVTSCDTNRNWMLPTLHGILCCSESWQYATPQPWSAPLDVRVSSVLWCRADSIRFNSTWNSTRLLYRSTTAVLYVYTIIYGIRQYTSRFTFTDRPRPS